MIIETEGVGDETVRTTTEIEGMGSEIEGVGSEIEGVRIETGMGTGN